MLFFKCQHHFPLWYRHLCVKGQFGTDGIHFVKKKPKNRKKPLKTAFATLYMMLYKVLFLFNNHLYQWQRLLLLQA